MPSQQFEQNFSRGKQELDIDDKFLPKGAYRYGQNITIARSESSDAGVVQSVRGNQPHRPSTFTADQTNHCIGIYKDNLNDRIYWFFVGSVTEGLYEFDLNTNETNRILEFTRASRVLRFSLDNRITGINIVNNLLHWTDGVNRPRRVNVERFRGTTIDPQRDNTGANLVDINTNIVEKTGASSVAITPTFDDDLLSVAKRPPLFPPTIVNTHTDNNYGTPGTPLYESLVSFSYRYIYADGEVSVFSPFTQAAFFPENYSVSRDTGILNSMINRYNSVDLKYDVGNREVTEIELLFKESGSNNVYVLATINKADNFLPNSTPYQTRYSTFTYDTTKVYRLLPSDQLTRIYDAVPLKAQAQEFIGNRLVYGNFTENYPLTVDNENGGPVVPDFNLGFTSSRKGESNQSPSKSCKSDRYYEAAITYLDKYGVSTPSLIPRRADSASSNTVYIPLGNSADRNQLTLEINHRAPYWATHYRINIKQTRAPWYNIFPTDVIVVDADDLAYLQIPSLDDATTTDEVSGVSSTLNKVNKDDIIILKSYSRSEARDAEIERKEFRVEDVGFINSDDNANIMEDGVYITVVPILSTDLNDIPTSAATKGTTIWETVPNDGNLELFFEYGQTYRCENGIHTANIEELIRIDSDKQTIVYNEDGSFASINSVNLTLCWFNAVSYSNGVESMHIRDEFFGTALEQGARASTVVEEYRQREQISNLIHSSVFNDDINRNGLNEFNPTNVITTELDLTDGSIQKLYARDTNLIVFQEDKIKTVPINKNLIQTAGGSSQLTVSSQFFGTESSYQQNYGISTNPESFDEYGSAVFFSDANRGAACRLGANGITEISANGIESEFRTDSRVAQEILGGYDQYHKRMFYTLKNTPVIEGIANSVVIEISDTGCADPRAECTRDSRLLSFRDVYVNQRGNGITDVGDAVFIDQANMTPFNGNFRWYGIKLIFRTLVTFDQVIQISPDGIITSIVTSCDSTYPTTVEHIPFNISSERFDDEFDACANGIVDSLAFLGCPLDSNGDPTTCVLTSNSEPDPSFIIYEDRRDLIPSSRTGWYMTSEADGLQVIYCEEGRVITKVSCDEISAGRRRIQGSGAISIIPSETDFNRNLRLCINDIATTEYFWVGEKERPENGNLLYTNNINNTLAVASRFYVFDDGYFVRLNSSSEVDLVGNCFTRQCNSDPYSLFSEITTGFNGFDYTYNGDAPLLGVEIEWIQVGDSRYPITGTYVHTVDRIDPGDTIVLDFRELNAELRGGRPQTRNREIRLVNVCFRAISVTAGDSLIHRTAASTSIATLCGQTASTPLYFNESELVYYSDSQLTTVFNGGGLLYGITLAGVNMTTTLVYQIAADGTAVDAGTIYCDFQHPLSLTYDSNNGQESCGLTTSTYYANMANFSSAGTQAATSLILPGSGRTTAPDGFYSNKVVIRTQARGILANNETQGCATLNALNIQFGSTLVAACHSGTNVAVFSDNNALNSSTTKLFQTAGYTGVPASGFYSDGTNVAQWDGTTLTFMNACPVQLNTFTFSDWTGSPVLNEDGVLTFNIGNAASVSNTAPAQTFTPSGADVQESVNVSVEVPVGFENTGAIVTGTRTVTRPARTFLFSDWTGSAAVALNGDISFVNGNAQAVANLPVNNFSAVGSATSRIVNVSVTVPASGYSNSNNTVTGTFLTIQLATQFPLFRDNDWTGVVSITQVGGVISATQGNSAATVVVNTSNFGTNSGVNPVTRTVSVTIRVPSGNFANAGELLTFNVEATQAGTGVITPTWSAAAWTGSINSISQSGNVSFTNGNGSVTITSNHSANSTSGARNQTVTYSVAPPASGYTGGAFTGSIVLSQPGLSSYSFGSWNGSVTIAASGVITATTGNSAGVSVTTSQFSTVSVNTSRSVSVTVTVPDGFSNSGSTVPGTRTNIIQPATQASAYTFATWNGSAAVDAAGNISFTLGNAANVVNSPVDAFPTVTVATSRTIRCLVTVPSGFSNEGSTVSGTRTDIQEATSFSISANTAGFDSSWGYTETDTRTIAVTTTPTQGTWSVSSVPSNFNAVKSGNNLVINSTGGTNASGHSGNVIITHSGSSSSTVSIPVSIEAQAIVYTITAGAERLAFSGSAGSQAFAVTTGPTANRFTFSASDDWINVTISSGMANITVESLEGTGSRAGSVTFSHLDDRSVTIRVSVNQNNIIR